MNRIFNRLSAFVCIVCCLFLSACAPQSPVENSKREIFAFRQARYDITVGESVALTFIVKDVHGYSEEKIVVTSSAPEIAKVEDKTLTAISEGSATLTAKYDNRITSVATVNVKKGEGNLGEDIVGSLEFGKENYIALTGRSVSLSINSSQIKNFDESKLAVTSSDESVLSGNTLTLVAKKAGTATVTATYGKYTATATVTVYEGATENEVKEFSSNAVVVQGRAYKNAKNELVFDNVNSGLEYAFYGTKSEVVFSVPSSYSGNPLYICAYVDGNEVGKFIPLDRYGSSVTYQVTENLPEGLHKVVLMKATEQHLWTALARSMTVKSLVQNEDCAIVKQVSGQNRLKIDFYGDSITCGLSNLGATPEYATSMENGTLSYAAITGRRLNALVSCVSYSGITVGCEFNLGKTTMLSIWNKDSALHNAPYTVDKTTDFVVVNLGTNDTSAFYGGKTTQTELKAHVRQLVGELRTAYGANTKIIWAYGMMGEDAIMKNTVQAVLNELGGEGNGYYYLSLEKVATGGAGAHPLVAGHEAGAEKLIALINSLQ